MTENSVEQALMNGVVVRRDHLKLLSIDFGAGDAIQPDLLRQVPPKNLSAMLFAGAVEVAEQPVGSVRTAPTEKSSSGKKKKKKTTNKTKGKRVKLQ